METSIDLAELKVKHAIEDFPPEKLTSEDLDDYKDSLKEVTSLLRVLEGLADDVLIDPPEGADEAEKSRLNNILDSLLKVVSNHTAAV